MQIARFSGEPMFVACLWANWVDPDGVESDPANLQALYAIFDDKRHPFYEHKIAT